MRVVYTVEAVRELRVARHWYNRRAPGIGDRLADLVDEKIGEIARVPASFPRDHRDPITTAPPPPLSQSVEEGVKGYVPPGSPTKAEVLACLDRERGNVSRVARALGMQRNTVYRLMQSYGIKKGDVV